MATKTYNMEMEAAAAFGAIIWPSFPKPLKVVAIMSEKAAMTSREKSQQNARNSFPPVRPTYFQ